MPKIRIGFGLGTRTLTNDADTFGAFVDVLERLRFDSLWLSERLTGDAPDPLVALAYAAGRTKKLKLGTSVLVVPGRNPVVLAKELAIARPAERRPPAPGGGPRCAGPGRAPRLRRGPQGTQRVVRRGRRARCAGSGPRTTSTTRGLASRSKA